MKRLLSLFAAICIAVSLSGCGSYKEGYQEGYDKGYSKGFDDAYYDKNDDPMSMMAIDDIDTAGFSFELGTGMTPQEALEAVASYIDGDPDYTEYEISSIVVELRRYCRAIDKAVFSAR